MEKRGIRTRAARHAVNTSLQARLPRSLRASCPRHLHIPVHRPRGRRSCSPGPGATSNAFRMHLQRHTDLSLTSLGCKPILSGLKVWVLPVPCRLQTDCRFFQQNGVVLISSGQRLDIEIRYRQRILFDEIPARFHLVSHQGGKDFIGADGILDLYLQQAPGIRIHGGFP